MKIITRYKFLVLLTASFAFLPSYANEAPKETSSKNSKSIENEPKEVEPTATLSLWAIFNRRHQVRVKKCQLLALSWLMVA